MSEGEDRGLTKLTAKFFAPMYADFDKQIAHSLLRRDAFLDLMIHDQIKHLREDLAGKRLSESAHRYISQSLKSLGGKDSPPLKPVSIAVRHETAKMLREAVKEHNLVRDAFLNRLMALLRSSDLLLNALDLPYRIESRRFSALGLEMMPTSPMKAILETLGDPFYYLRQACLDQHGCGLYLLEFPVEYVAFSCYLDDEQVPGTTAHLRKKKNEEELLADLGFLESNLTPVKSKGA